MRSLVVPLLLAGALAAQTPFPAGKLPVRGDAEHELQLYDLASLIEARGDRRSRPEDAGPELAEFARAFAEPELQHAEDVVALGAHYLVGLGRPEVHGWVHGFLQAQLEQGDQAIDLQLRVLHAHDKALERAGLKREPVMLEDEKALAERVGKLRGIGALDRLAGEPEVTEVSAPRLLTLQLQRASISVISQTSYVKSYELVAGEKPGDAAVAVPQRETVQDGLVLDCRAAVVQKDRVGVFCKIELTELDRPIAEKQTPNGPIGVPVTHRLAVERALSIPAGGGALVPLRQNDGRHLVVVITASPST